MTSRNAETVSNKIEAFFVWNGDYSKGNLTKYTVWGYEISSDLLQIEISL